MSRFEFIPTPIAGLMLVQRLRSQDSRGFFGRFFCAAEFQAIGFELPIAQINHTHTVRQGAVRGLHFQHPPYAEDKLVSCLKGRIFDVAVDLRQGSPTFMKWHAEILSAENARSLLVPQGCAHGFQTLEPDCELIYLHSRAYMAAAEGALNARDPRLAIEWPLSFTDISERDARHPHLTPDFEGFRA
jgi:dTDP-4-dehydrorhamnose 3,5-epimerase